MPHRTARRLAPLLLATGLMACGGPGDFERPGTWRATGANEANLRAMLAEPAHAAQGAAAPTERAQPGSRAIRRLEEGRRAPLPDTRAARIGADPGASAVPEAPGAR